MTSSSAPSHVDVDDDAEARWRDTVRASPVNQLTARAVVGGMAIGAVMCLSNLYVFFKTGWSLGVTLTAVILAYATFTALRALRVTKSELTLLENNALATVASGAGYMTAGGNMAAFGALLMVTTVRPSAVSMMAWFAVIAAMGVFAAIPIKSQLINKDKLPFPTGTATAETLRSLHGTGQQTDGAADGGSAAKVLGFAALGAGLLTLVRDIKAPWMPFNVPGSVGLPFTIAGRAAKDWTLALKTEVVLFGAGALMSFRTGWSVLLGGVLTYAVLAPSLLAQKLITDVNYKSIVAFTVWPGASMLVAAGLTSFALDWKSIARAFSGIGSALLRRNAPSSADSSDDIEAPAWWFPAGFLLLSPIVIFLMVALFDIPWWAGLVAVPLAVVMGFVAARVTGETDVTPTKALGPVTQLLFGAMTPGNLSGNIMSANVTGGIGLHAADLLTTMKTGYLVGARPRQQIAAQLFGVVAGAVMIVPAFFLLFPDPSVLGSDAWPAPSCLVWAGVSKAFAGGLDSLGAAQMQAIVVAGVLGVALTLLERFAPKKAKTYLPSPSGIGIAMVIPGSNSIAMFLGSLTAALMQRYKPAVAERTVVPVASGLIAGESLMGIVVALLIAFGVLAK